MGGAVFKTAREIARVSLGGFDSHTPPPTFRSDFMAAEIFSTDKTEDDFKEHTKKIALRIIEQIESFPETRNATLLAGQLIGSVSSIAAEYRSAGRQRTNEGIARKLRRVESETERTLFLLEISIELGFIDIRRLVALTADLDEILRRTNSSIEVLNEKRS